MNKKQCLYICISGKLDHKHMNFTKNKGEYLVILIIKESLHQKLIILNI